MGLKCSVLGHKYGETTVEREREEQGSEVVITIQERETCERCGNTRIVSENKEVTSIETPSDIAGDVVDEQDDESGTGDSTAGGEQSDTEEIEQPPETREADESGDTDDVVDAVEETGVVDPSADDAEIIDDSEETESGDVELDQPSTVDVPDAESESSTGDETDPEEDDGLIIDEADDEDRSDDERQPGEWPEEPDSGDDDWTPETIPAEEVTDGDSDVEPVGSNAVTVPEGQFRCPECGFTTEVESTSLRAGDFCPECHKGSLVNERDE